MLTVLGALTTASWLLIFYILARLSEKFGSVLKMPPLYRWLYVSEGLATIALLAHLMQASFYLAAPRQHTLLIGLPFTLLFHHLPLTVAATIALAVTWKYWGWLITERNDR